MSMPRNLKAFRAVLLPFTVIVFLLGWTMIIMVQLKGQKIVLNKSAR